MNIMVCIKPVKKPDNAPLDRDEYIINPYDLHALKEALTWKKKLKGVTITALCMGSEQAETVIRQAIRLGADEGYLITDKLYAGSDTLATSRILSTAIRYLDSYNLILCGYCSIDGNTGQVGGATAEKLDIPHITNVTKILQIDALFLVCERYTENTREQLELKLPALLTMAIGCNTPDPGTLQRVIMASRLKVACLTNQELKLAPEQCGLSGSPTRVIKTENLMKQKNTLLLPGKDLKREVAFILKKINADYSRRGSDNGDY